MKFRLTVKDPDAIWECARDAVNARVAELRATLRPSEIDAVREGVHREMSAFVNSWCQYGDYLTVEFDTDANTCVVIKEGLR